MNQLINYLKRINGTIKYPYNDVVDNSKDRDDNEEEETDDDDNEYDSSSDENDEKREEDKNGPRPGVEYHFTVNFEQLLKKKHRLPRRQVPPWWSENCEVALLARKKAKKILKKTGDENREQNLKEYQKARSLFKKISKKAKSSYYKKVKKEIEMHESVVF